MHVQIWGGGGSWWVWEYLLDKLLKKEMVHRMRVHWANGSNATIGVGIDALGVPITFQNLSFSFSAADAQQCIYVGSDRRKAPRVYGQ